MIDEATITRLVNEAASTVPIMTVYDMALKNIDIEAMQAAQALTREELCANMAMGGFIAGIRFALENIEIKSDSDSGAAQEAAGAAHGAGVVSLPSETLKIAQEAAEAAGDGLPQFIDRAVGEQAKRDKRKRSKIQK